MASRECPAVLLSAPASGQGKTTLTSALAGYHRAQGRTVRVFKTGPDFLDPMILERASSHPVHHLDLWMVGEQRCRELLYSAAAEADLILIEGVMGLFDGTPSSADLAEFFDVPVMLFVDASAMAQTFAAVIHGLVSYRPSLNFHGVLANQVGSVSHGQMLAECLQDGPPFLGALVKDEKLRLPHRHLGLVQASEIDDLEQRLLAAAQAIGNTAAVALPPPVSFPAASGTAPPPLLRGRRIAVARDEAFAFVYAANLTLLEEMGAELAFFSPLRDQTLPTADAVYLPGGYPELHLQALSENQRLHQALRAHAAAGRRIYAECGGMLYLLETLTDQFGKRAEMAGLMPGHAFMQKRLAALGMQSVTLPQGRLTGHTFHHSQMQSALTPWLRGHRQRGEEPGERLYRHGSVIASYLHLYWPSNPVAAAELFR